MMVQNKNQTNNKRKYYSNTHNRNILKYTKTSIVLTNILLLILTLISKITRQEKCIHEYENKI